MKLQIKTPHNDQPLIVYKHKRGEKFTFCSRGIHDELIYLFTSLQQQFANVKIKVYEPNITFSNNITEYMEIVCTDNFYGGSHV